MKQQTFSTTSIWLSALITPLLMTCAFMILLSILTVTQGNIVLNDLRLSLFVSVFFLVNAMATLILFMPVILIFHRRNRLSWEFSIFAVALACFPIIMFWFTVFLGITIDVLLYTSGISIGIGIVSGSVFYLIAIHLARNDIAPSQNSC